MIIFMNDKVMAPQVVIDVSRIPDLTGLCFDPETGLRIGAATKYRTIELSAEVKQHYPYLQQGAEEVGSVQIRNLGTPGGQHRHGVTGRRLPDPAACRRRDGAAG